MLEATTASNDDGHVERELLRISSVGIARDSNFRCTRMHMRTLRRWRAPQSRPSQNMKGDATIAFFIGNLIIAVCVGRTR